MCNLTKIRKAGVPNNYNRKINEKLMEWVRRENNSSSESETGIQLDRYVCDGKFV